MGIVSGLKKISEEKLVSFHMPGHKGGRLLSEYLNASSMLEMDITEIPGSDNLHCPQTHVLDTLAIYRKLYHSKESFLLINGSTVGILAMILSQTRLGDKIILNRFAHKSVHNAVKINGLDPIYILPKTDDYGVIRGLEETWQTIIEENSPAKAIVLTYPTYEGTVYDLKKVIDCAHKHDMVVIVDEAHGAHLTFSEKLPHDALTLGADLVVQSLHKTLPSVTQTAILHTMGNRYNEERLAFYLSALQSSSPSYMFLQSMDACALLMQDRGYDLMDELLRKTENLVRAIKELGFDVIDTDDITKVMICPNRMGYTGSDLEEILRKEYAIQCEYSTDVFALLMVSIANTKEDFMRLLKALESIESKGRKEPVEAVIFNRYEKPIVKVKPSELSVYDYEVVMLSDLKGHVMMENIVPYPPGIPLIMAGEQVSDSHLESIVHLKESGYKVIGVKDTTLEGFRVIGKKL